MTADTPDVSRQPRSFGVTADKFTTGFSYNGKSLSAVSPEAEDTMAPINLDGASHDFRFIVADFFEEEKKRKLPSTDSCYDVVSLSTLMMYPLPRYTFGSSSENTIHQ